MLNIISIPSPLWFVAFDLLIYLPAAYFGGWLIEGRTKPKSA
jgi:hypothetical protein